MIVQRSGFPTRSHPQGTTYEVGVFSYTWDANRNKATEAITGTMSGYGFDSTTYDDEDRLTAWNRVDDAKDQSWSLSLVGDWNSFTEESATQNRTHGDAHEVLTVDSVSVTHDATGNVTLIPSTLRASACALEWDFDNRLSAADTDNDSNPDIGFGYDALGRRVQKGDTVYAFDAWQVIAQYESGNSPSIPDEQYVYASYVDEPILKEGTVPGGTGIVYYHRNQQYSVVALTDDQGEVVERYACDPHGNLSIFDETGAPISATAYANPYTWTGREFDAETGLYYFRARYFDPAMGRFLSRDPLGYVDGMGLYFAPFAFSGADPWGLHEFEWHHLVPKEWTNWIQRIYSDDLGRMGLTAEQWRDRAENGWILPVGAHRKIHPAWNREFDAWLAEKYKRGRGYPASLAQLETDAHIFMVQWAKGKRHLKRGGPAQIEYDKWGAGPRDPAKRAKWYRDHFAAARGIFRENNLADSFAKGDARGICKVRGKFKVLTGALIGFGLFEYVEPIYGFTSIATGGCDRELETLRMHLHGMSPRSVDRISECQEAIDLLAEVLRCGGVDDSVVTLVVNKGYPMCEEFGSFDLEEFGDLNTTPDGVPFEHRHGRNSPYSRR